MSTFTAHILSGSTCHRIDILAEDMQHARELVIGEGRALFGRRGFSFTVRSEQ